MLYPSIKVPVGQCYCTSCKVPYDRYNRAGGWTVGRSVDALSVRKHAVGSMSSVGGCLSRQESEVRYGQSIRALSVGNCAARSVLSVDGPCYPSVEMPYGRYDRVVDRQICLLIGRSVDRSVWYPPETTPLAVYVVIDRSVLYSYPSLKCTVRSGLSAGSSCRPSAEVPYSRNHRSVGRSAGVLSVGKHAVGWVLSVGRSVLVSSVKVPFDHGCRSARRVVCR